MYYSIGAGKLTIFSDIQRETVAHEASYPDKSHAGNALVEYVQNAARMAGSWVVIRTARDGSSGCWDLCDSAEDAHRVANAPHPVTAPGVIIGPDGTAYHMPRATLDRFLDMVRRA